MSGIETIPAAAPSAASGATLASLAGELEMFHFGPGSSLFGALQRRAPAASDPAGRGRAVVCAYPVGHESIRCHRAFRMLSQMLAASGLPTLRFDGFGCGDSLGEHHEATLARWQADLAAAMKQARGRCRVIPLALVGLRLGASLAALAGAQRGDVEELVLWDPVVSGKRYLRELRDEDAALREEIRGKTGHAAPPEPEPGPGGAAEFRGFAYGGALLGELAALDLARIDRAPARHVLLITTPDDDETAPASASADFNAAAECPPEESTLTARLRELGCELTVQRGAGPRLWRAEPFRGIMPVETLRAIATWLAEVRA